MATSLSTGPEPAGTPRSGPAVGLRDVAREAGVSVATASFALNGNPRCAEATRAAVADAARRLGYRKSDAVSRTLTAVRNRRLDAFRDTVACIAGGVKLDAALEQARAPGGAAHPPFMGWTQLAVFARGLRIRAAETGVALDHFSLADQEPDAIAGVMRARGIRAAILSLRDAGFERAQRLVSALHGVRLVILGSCPLNPPPGTAIGCDLFAAGRRIFFEAWRAGYRRVVLCRPPPLLDPERRFEAGATFALGTFPGHPPLETLTAEQASGPALGGIFAAAGQETCFAGAIEPDLIPPSPGKPRGGRPGWLSWHANLIPQPEASGIDQRDEEQARCAVEEALALSAEGGGGFHTRNDMELLLEPGWRAGASAPIWRNDHLNLLPDAPFEGATGPWKPLPLGRAATAVFRTDAPWRRLMPLPVLEPGTWYLHGVPFRVTATDSGGAAGLLLLASSTHPRERGTRLPSQAALGVGVRVRAINFLHTCGYIGQGGEIARYTFRYASGESVSAPLLAIGRPKPGSGPVAGANIQDWNPSFLHSATATARPVCLLDAALRPGDTGYAYVYRWTNPHPRRRLEGIRVEVDASKPAMFALCALTLEQG